MTEQTRTTLRNYDWILRNRHLDDVELHRAPDTTRSSSSPPTRPRAFPPTTSPTPSMTTSCASPSSSAARNGSPRYRCTSNCSPLVHPPITYAHIAPLMKTIPGGGKRKLSKRKDPEAGIDYYIQAGYPADAVLYYLRGLANGRHAEIPLPDALATPIQLDQCGVAGPLVDLIKLEDISANHIATLTGPQILTAVTDWAAGHDPNWPTSCTPNPTSRSAPSPSNATASRTRAGPAQVVGLPHRLLQAQPRRLPGSIREASQLVRLALTSSTRSPDMHAITRAIGNEEVLRRLRTLAG